MAVRAPATSISCGRNGVLTSVPRRVRRPDVAVTRIYGLYFFYGQVGHDGTAVRAGCKAERCEAVYPVSLWRFYGWASVRGEVIVRAGLTTPTGADFTGIV